MHVIIALILFGHGLSHLVGFLAAWRLMAPDKLPPLTTFLCGRVAVGEVSARLLGLVWLLLTIAFSVAALGALLRAGYWPRLTLSLAACSLVMCVLEGLEAKVGVVVNLIIVAFLLIALKAGWPLVG